MPKFNALKNNFSIGELSPRLFGRSDTPTFQNAGATIENYIVLLGGGLASRCGTQYVAETKDSTKASRLIPFIASALSSYVLEFGDNYIRVYTNGAQIISGESPYEITTTYSENELDNLDYCQEGNTMYIVHPDHAPATLVCNGDTDWTFSTLSLLGPFSAKGFSSTIDLTLSAATVGAGRTVTAASGVFLAGDVGRKLTDGVGQAYITGYTSATVVTATIEVAFASTSVTNEWTLESSPQTTLTPDKKSGGAGTVVSIASDKDAFRSSDVGKYLKCAHGVLHIQTFTDAKHISGLCKVEFSDAEDTLEAGTWSIVEPLWEASNYPKAVTLYQQRLVFGGTNAKPQTIWGSKSGDKTNFNLGSMDDESYEFTISTDTVAPILFLTSSKTIVAHTYLNEFTISGSSDNPLTPSNVSIEQRSSFGCSFVKPEKIGNLTVFVQRAGTKVRAFQYNFVDDAYDAPDTAAFAEHITSIGVREMAYAQEPDSTLLCVLNDGQIGVLAIDVKQGLQGWSRLVTNGAYESVANIPIVGEDQTWVIVNRDDKRYVEMFVRGTNTDFHMIQSSETLETVWSGFDHLEGLTVDIIADGSPQPQQTVTDGTITLTRGAYDVEVGLEYDSTLVDLPVEVAGSGVGQTAQGSHMSCNEVVVRFYNTKTAVINGNVQTFRRFGESVLDQPIAFFTGDLDVHLIQGWSDRGQNSIQRVDPLQQIIVGIYKKVSIND